MLEIVDATYEQVDDVIKKIKKKYKQAHSTKDGSKKLCVFVYYAGHGVMNNTNYIVVNEENR